MRRLPLALLLLAHGLAAGATTVNDLCSAPNVVQGNKPCACTTTPLRCRFTGVAGVTSPSTLDFGTRSVELAPGAKIQVAARGSFTILAAGLDMQATKNGASGLLAPGGTIDVRTTGDIAVRRLGGNVSRIVGGDAATGITLDSATGDIIVDGLLDAAATVDSPNAGDVTLTARNVTIGGDIDVRGGIDDSAGTITISAEGGGNIMLPATARILGTGARTGADLSMDAEGHVSCEGTLDLKGVGGGNQGGDGGTLGISAPSGSVVLGGTVKLNGTSGTDFGAAGEVDVDAGGAITLSGLIDQIGPPAGNGGYSYFSSGLDITQTGEIKCSSQGAQGDGGSVEFDAGRALTLGQITCTGGDNGVLQNYVYAESACDLRLPTGRTIDTRGPRGDTTLVSGALITVDGRLLSAANTIQYGQTPPAIARGAVVPNVPGPQFVAALKPCPPPPACGNGILEGVERCDDGNTVSGDGCDVNCTPTACGNGIVTAGEACDDGDAEDGDLCDSNCTPTGCGNNVQTSGEECDLGDQNGAPGVPCKSDCTVPPPPGCGNGKVDAGEQSYVGNQNECDGCSNSCLNTGCGNGNVEVACGEQCDDQNVSSGDGCSATCQIEACGNGVVDRGEECDSGAQNGQLGTPCSTLCQRAWCGNGVRDALEACDDANQNECDGCGSACNVPATPCPVCTAGATQQCVPCADTVDCDPLRACGASACVAGACTPVTPPNCDDGNGCTTDTCDPARGCVSAPVECQDATACDGTASCDPATGQCVASAAPSCDDQDECTDDACSEATPGFRCTNQLRPGLAGATCRLAALQRLIASPEIPNATRKKLGKQAGSIAKRLPAAAGTGKKAAKARKQVTSGLKALRRTLAKAQKKMPSEAFDQIDAAVTRFSQAGGF
jgi:cysteine-rich repeat protein